MTRTFFLAVPPRAAARTRATCRGRFAQVYKDPKYREWLTEAIAQLHQIDAPWPVDAPFDGDVDVGLEVVVAKPKATKKRRPRGDRDNFEKGIFDALTQAGGWWKDDDQIVSGPFVKRWAKPGEPEGYHITIKYLPEEAK